MFRVTAVARSVARRFGGTLLPRRRQAHTARNPYLTERAWEQLRDTNGKSIECKAAVAWEPKAPLDVTTVQVQPPQAGEVRVRVISNALCHTDVYTLEGHDPEGLFPCILGHEAAALVESVGEGVTSVQTGDLVIPCYTPECGSAECVFCSSPKTNLCPAIRGSQGQGVMPDNTTRFSKDGAPIYHFMGCSTFSEYTVIAEISAARIPPSADPRLMCMLGCGLSTGWGAVENACNVEPGTSVAVFGLGALGLSVIQAARRRGARLIVGVDTNPAKFEVARKFGATEFVDASTENVRERLLEREQWGYDYTFDCTGNTQVMRDALEVAHRGWGESCVIGVAAAGHEISTRPFQLVTGRVWKGTAFGGWKSRTEVPKLVQSVMRGELSIDSYVTHTFEGLEHVNEAIDALHSGDCLRAVVNIGESGMEGLPQPVKLVSDSEVKGGRIKQIKHWSEANKCEMTFSVFLPHAKERAEAPPGVLYYLSGLTCTDENARTKSMFQSIASRYNLALVFPDTSPRGVEEHGTEGQGDFGAGAGFYVDATTDEWSEHNNMYSYITHELPELVRTLFPVDGEKAGIMGHSMGGHGALVAHLRNPGKYQSVSALSPICHPTAVPWGRKAFAGYLGSVEAGEEYDATLLVGKYDGPRVPILVDVGTHDPFKDEQLKPEVFKSACARAGYPLELRLQDGHDHSYWFVSSVMEDHIRHHATSMGLRER